MGEKFTEISETTRPLVEAHTHLVQSMEQKSDSLLNNEAAKLGAIALIPGAGILSFLAGTAKVEKEHIATIKTLSDNNFPGMNSGIIMIESIEYEYHVDALALYEGGDPEECIKIYLEPTDPDIDFENEPDYYDIEMVENALRAQAIEEVHQYAQNNGGEASYAQLTKDTLAGKNNYLALKEPEPAPLKESIMASADKNYNWDIDPWEDDFDMG